MRERRQAFPRFLVVGAATALLSAAAIVALIRLAGVAPLTAVVIVAILGNAWGFHVNRQWSFLVSHGRPWRQLARYLVVAAISVGCSVGLFAVLTDRWQVDHGIASLAVSAIFALTNFLAHFHWSFAPPRPFRSGS